MNELTIYKERDDYIRNLPSKIVDFVRKNDYIKPLVYEKKGLRIVLETKPKEKK